MLMKGIVWQIKKRSLVFNVISSSGKSIRRDMWAIDLTLINFRGRKMNTNLS